MFKNKNHPVFPSCASFFGLPAHPKPPKTLCWFFLPRTTLHMTPSPPHGAASQRCHQSLPERSCKIMPKGENMKKRYSPRLFFGKKKTLVFKNPVKTPEVRWLYPFLDVYVFFSHQKVLTMIHLGLALHSEGRPVFKKGRLNIWTRNVCAKWWKMIRKNKTEPLNMKLSIWQASIFQYSYPPWN